MKVNRSLIVGTVLTSLMGLVSVASVASEPVEATAQEEASLVVYRVDESMRTDRLRIAVRVGNERLGRLQSDDSLSTVRPAGTYLVSTGIDGAETLKIDLKPGKVHYVRIDPRERTQDLRVSVVEVEERVAHIERPETGSAI